MDDYALQTLVDLGLTGYEANAYVALTRREHATAAEVARIARLPRQRVYDVLDGLVGRGLVTVTGGRPARYAARAPEEALGQLLEQQQAQLRRLEGEVAEAVARLMPAFSAGRDANDPLDFIEVLRNPPAIARRFAELQASVEREILVFTKPPYAVEPGENVEGLELLSRNVNARSVYERSIYDHPAHVEAIHTFIAAGEQARVVDRLPLKLVLIDERVSMFTLKDPLAGEPQLTIMIVEHPALAGLLKLSFERMWESGEPFS